MDLLPWMMGVFAALVSGIVTIAAKQFFAISAHMGKVDAHMSATEARLERIEKQLDNIHGVHSHG